MQFGAHLPLIDFEGRGYKAGELDAFTEAARDLGYASVSSNDHFVFQKPWLDGLTALSSVIHCSGDMTLATTISLPVVRHPVALAKAAAAIDILSGGRLVLGVGPGSSARDYGLVGVSFDERWKRLDESLRVLRCHLCGEEAPEGGFYTSNEALEPAPNRPKVPIWLGSWGSDAGLRRVARLADGWLASAYNTTPAELSKARENLDAELQRHGKDPATFPCALATMWMYVTEDARERNDHLTSLAQMLNRPPAVLAEQVLIGSAEECAGKLRAYEEAGVATVFLWPLADSTAQLERFMTMVAPEV